MGTGDDKHKERLLLFEFHKEVFKGPFTLQGPQTHEWLFDFVSIPITLPASSVADIKPMEAYFKHNS